MALRRHAHREEIRSLESAPVTLASEETDASTSTPLGANTGELWDFYEQLGEVHYPLNLGGNIASKVDVGLRVRNPEGAWIAPPKNGGQQMRLARQAMDMILANPIHDHFRRFWLLISVPGQAQLYMGKDDFGEMKLEVLSTDEIRVDTSGQIWRQGSREYLGGGR